MTIRLPPSPPRPPIGDEDEDLDEVGFSIHMALDKAAPLILFHPSQCCGPVLAIAGCILLVWNEGRRECPYLGIDLSLPPPRHHPAPK